MIRIFYFLVLIVSILLWGSPVGANEHGAPHVAAKKTSGGETASGTFVSADFKKKLFEVIIGEQHEKFSFNGGTKFLREDAAIFLSDVLPGEVLEVTYSVRGSRKIARLVRVEPSRLLRMYGAMFTRGY